MVISSLQPLFPNRPPSATADLTVGAGAYALDEFQVFASTLSPATVAVKSTAAITSKMPNCVLKIHPVQPSLPTIVLPNGMSGYCSANARPITSIAGRDGQLTRFDGAQWIELRPAIVNLNNNSPSPHGRAAPARLPSA